MRLVGGTPPFSQVVPPEAAPPGNEEQFGPAYVRWDGAAYAPRSYATDSQTRPVIWIGPIAPPINNTYAQDNLDLWWKTTE
jgi:hypothetical protein